MQNNVEVADPVGLTPGKGLTVSAWVQLPAEADGIILSQRSYSLGIAKGHLLFALSHNGEERPLNSPGVIANKEWHHVAGVY